jgi:hypothetical protein
MSCARMVRSRSACPSDQHSSAALVVIGTIVLAVTPVSNHKVGYFCTFLIASGSFIPSCLWQR